jgi:hypothetical protein
MPAVGGVDVRGRRAASNVPDERKLCVGVVARVGWEPSGSAHIGGDVVGRLAACRGACCVKQVPSDSITPPLTTVGYPAPVRDADIPAQRTTARPRRAPLDEAVEA